MGSKVKKNIIFLDKLWLLTLTGKTKTMAFLGKQTVRTKIVIDGKIMEQVQHFNYMGRYVTYGTEIDLDEELNKFRNICGTIHKYFKNKGKMKQG